MTITARILLPALLLFGPPRAAAGRPAAQEVMELGKKYAVVVGISRYGEASFNLDAAAKDASEMAVFLGEENRTGGYQVQLLTDEKATRLALAEALLAVRDRAGPLDTVLFFYSGHGFLDAKGRPFLFPHDGRRRLLEDTAYSLEKVVRILDRTQARQKVVFLDCCHSGAVGDSLLASAKGTETRVVSSDALEKLLGGTGLAIISSSRGDQLSWEDTGPGGTGMGIFTKYLLRGLRGEADGDWSSGRGNRDGYVSVQELLEFVYYGANAEVTEKRGRPQQATLVGRITAPIYLSLVPESLTRGPGSGPLAVPAGQGVLTFESTPPGAAVFVDGTRMPQATPADLLIALGPRRVRVEKDGFQPWTGEVTVGPGVNQPVSAVLIPGAPASDPSPPARADPDSDPSRVSPETAHQRGVSLHEAGQFALAIPWLERAATAGHAKAQALLGLSYAQGRGVPIDTVEAVRWYRQAADQGYAKAQNLLGLMQLEGHGTPKDPTQAAAWFRRSAAQHDPRGQLYLGLMYDRGLGLARDGAEAVRLVQQAARSGDPEARAWLRSRTLAW